MHYSSGDHSFCLEAFLPPNLLDRASAASPASTSPAEALIDRLSFADELVNNA